MNCVTLTRLNSSLDCSSTTLNKCYQVAAVYLRCFGCAINKRSIFILHLNAVVAVDIQSRRRPGIRWVTRNGPNGLDRGLSQRSIEEDIDRVTDGVKIGCPNKDVTRIKRLAVDVGEDREGGLY